MTQLASDHYCDRHEGSVELISKRMGWDIAQLLRSIRVVGLFTRGMPGFTRREYSDLI